MVPDLRVYDSHFTLLGVYLRVGDFGPPEANEFLFEVAPADGIPARGAHRHYRKWWGTRRDNEPSMAPELEALVRRVLAPSARRIRLRAPVAFVISGDNEGTFLRWEPTPT